MSTLVASRKAWRKSNELIRAPGVRVGPQVFLRAGGADRGAGAVSQGVRAGRAGVPATGAQPGAGRRRAAGRRAAGTVRGALPGRPGGAGSDHAHLAELEARARVRLTATPGAGGGRRAPAPARARAEARPAGRAGEERCRLGTAQAPLVGELTRRV